jgi:hypothetical protein
VSEEVAQMCGTTDMCCHGRFERCSSAPVEDAGIHSLTWIPVSSSRTLTLGNLVPTTNVWVDSEPPRGPCSFNCEVWRVRHKDYLFGNTTVDCSPPDELFRSIHIHVTMFITSSFGDYSGGARVRH